MPPVTNAEVEGIEIEREAATVLGYMVFEYSRLEMELGLLLVWSDSGKELDKLTEKISENFGDRLNILKKSVEKKYANAPATNQYAEWITDADAMRTLRNQLFHGRWGFMPAQQLVANVVGLPTSSKQTESRYSITQLNDLLHDMRALRTRLSKLRDTWPV